MIAGGAGRHTRTGGAATSPRFAVERVVIACDALDGAAREDGDTLLRTPRAASHPYHTTRTYTKIVLNTCNTTSTVNTSHIFTQTRHNLHKRERLAVTNEQPVCGGF